MIFILSYGINIKVGPIPHFCHVHKLSLTSKPGINNLLSSKQIVHTEQNQKIVTRVVLTKICPVALRHLSDGTRDVCSN